MKKMWFGTRGYCQWVPMVDADADFTKEGWSASTQFLNGGNVVRGSKAGHREYLMSWSAGRTRDELRPISDFADGVYDSDSTGLIYFISPDSADKNAAPQSLAFPGQEDAPSLCLDVQPSLVATSANDYGYPARSAQYVLAGTETMRKVYIPIPPDYSAWVGFHGSATGDAGLQVTEFVNGDSPYAAPTVLTPLGVNTSTRVNAEFGLSGGAQKGIEIQLVEDSGTITLSAIIVQILPTGVTPGVGNYISGQGHSGCRFVGKPQTTFYFIGSRRESIGMTARLNEVGAWL